MYTKNHSIITVTTIATNMDEKQKIFLHGTLTLNH